MIFISLYNYMDKIIGIELETSNGGINLVSQQLCVGQAQTSGSSFGISNEPVFHKGAFCIVDYMLISL